MARTITNNYGTLVTLSNAGDNPITIASTAHLSAGLYGDLSSGWTVVNYGAINETIAATPTGGANYGVVSAASAVLFITGSTFTNDGTVTASGSLSAGVDLTAGGTVINNGGITQSGDRGYAVDFADGGSLINAGTINGGGDYGVVFAADGSVSNATGGLIEGTGFQVSGLGFYGGSAGTGTVTNAGTIEGTRYGIYIQGGTITNLQGGVIQTTGAVANEVIRVANSVILNNQGTIAANNSDEGAVEFSLYNTVADVVSNASGGTISASDGTALGFYSHNALGSKSATVTNAGTIAGATIALHFAAGSDNRLIVEPGAVFSGTVDGGNAVGDAITSALELASGTSVGTLSGLGSHYINFADITIDTGATWRFIGTNTLAAGVTLTGGTIENDGVIMLDPSRMKAALTGTGSVTIGSDSTLEVYGTVAAGQTIVMTGTNDFLQIDSGTGFAGTITGFGGVGDVIDVQGVGLANSAVIGTNPHQFALYLRDAGNSTIFSFPNIATIIGAEGGPATLHFSADADGGTLIACYLRGTRIRTDRGEKPIEFLSVGDLVATLTGAYAPIRWIGRRRYALAATEGHAAVLPVLIRAGAVGDGLPRRDLNVSPEHALFIDGVLVPARHLTNGKSIVQRCDLEELEYFHLELGAHDIVFAEGLPAETFVDCDSRAMFDNARTYTGGGSPSWTFCAPRVEEGALLAGIRQRLNGRAGLDAERGTPGPLSGVLERLADGFAEGWAQDAAAPERPVRLEILADGAIVARVVANRHRDDLAAAGLGSGRHAFRVALPGAARRIEARRGGDGALLGVLFGG